MILPWRICQGRFDRIRDVMKGKHGEDAIAYNQGTMAMFTFLKCSYSSKCSIVRGLIVRSTRIISTAAPRVPYSSTKGILSPNPRQLELLVPRLPEILQLSDLIRQNTHRRESCGF